MKKHNKYFNGGVNVIDALVAMVAWGCEKEAFLHEKKVVKKMLKVSHKKINSLLDSRIQESCIFKSDDAANEAIGKKYWEISQYIYRTSCHDYRDQCWLIANR